MSERPDMLPPDDADITRRWFKGEATKEELDGVILRGIVRQLIKEATEKLEARVKELEGELADANIRIQELERDLDDLS